MGGRVKSLLHDGCRVEDAVRTAVAAAVQAVSLFVDGEDWDGGAAGVAGEFR